MPNNCYFEIKNLIKFLFANLKSIDWTAIALQDSPFCSLKQGRLRPIPRLCKLFVYSALASTVYINSFHNLGKGWRPPYRISFITHRKILKYSFSICILCVIKYVHFTNVICLVPHIKLVFCTNFVPQFIKFTEKVVRMNDFRCFFVVTIARPYIRQDNVFSDGSLFYAK